MDYNIRQGQCAASHKQPRTRKEMAPPWSAGTCHRFGKANLSMYNALYQSGDKSPHSKEAPFLICSSLRL